MKKQPQIALKPAHHAWLKYVPPPIVAPSPAVIRRLLFEVEQVGVELMVFVLLQVFLGLRAEEAYGLLLDPWTGVDGDSFCFHDPSGKFRKIQITPAASDWFCLMPHFHGHLPRDFRLFKKGKQVSLAVMTIKVSQLLRAAGFNPPGQMPACPLRKANISALVACGVPFEFIAQQTGLSSLKTLRRHYDPTWSHAMGMEFFTNFPIPDLTLYRAWQQPVP